MNTKKILFQNPQGREISGCLELPLNQEPHNFVLIVHCFASHSDNPAAKEIARSLTQAGYGVLRFDLTGTEKQVELAETSFYGNIEDLLSAAAFLEKQHSAPTMLIGHSLGGAAVILAARQLSSVKALAIIATPSSPAQIESLLENRAKEKAGVPIRDKKNSNTGQLFKDLEETDLPKIVAELQVSFLILHAPQDSIIGIENAETFYTAARHPKSFVSLDHADHVLSRTQDARYTGQAIAAWASRYLIIPERKELSTSHQVVGNLGKTGFTTHLKAGNHYFTADEPLSAGGNDYGPTPYDLLGAALAACTSMTIQMYVRRKQWPLHNVETHVTHDREHDQDCENCERTNAKIDVFHREILLEGDLDEKQKRRVLDIADKCPVHKTLHNEIKIRTALIKKV